MKTKEEAAKSEATFDAKLEKHVKRKASLREQQGKSRESFLVTEGKIEELKVDKEQEGEKNERYRKVKLTGIQRRHDKQLLNKDDTKKEKIRTLEFELTSVILEQNEKIQDAIDNE